MEGSPLVVLTSNSRLPRLNGGKYFLPLPARNEWGQGRGMAVELAYNVGFAAMRSPSYSGAADEVSVKYASLKGRGEEASFLHLANSMVVEGRGGRI